MPHLLQIHPDTPSSAVHRIEVALARSDVDLVLEYRVVGSMSQLLMPPPTPSARRDGLWQHSCFEAFLRTPGNEAYVEYNFSPSSEWAAYSFTRYRTGMTEADVAPPAIESQSTPGEFRMRVRLDVDETRYAELGLSAVIEEADGRMSLWALKHPPGKPDFHHPDCFALQLPPPAGPL